MISTEIAPIVETDPMVVENQCRRKKKNQRQPLNITSTNYVGTAETVMKTLNSGKNGINDIQNKKYFIYGQRSL
jgi:hypothetical protein